jgi:hypothetical protein
MESVKTNEGELTSTMGNLLSTSKEEKNDATDSTPTSSTDAFTTTSTSQIGILLSFILVVRLYGFLTEFQRLTTPLAVPHRMLQIRKRAQRKLTILHRVLQIML